MRFTATPLSSPANPRVKQVVRLGQRSHRDESGLMLIEGYRAMKRAIDSGIRPVQVFFSEAWFQGENEPALLDQCAASQPEFFSCTKEVFAKMAYRERPEGLLMLAPLLHRTLAELPTGPGGLFVIAQSIEKPGNLGTILRSADAAGAHGVIVCDRCTDIHNPNVIRASTGVIFSLPVVEAPSEDVLAWLQTHGIQTVAASPHAQPFYTEVDYTRSTALIVGAEQYGLTDFWMRSAGVQVRIPMLGKADSLNVASATTILLFEAVRQRHLARR